MTEVNSRRPKVSARDRPWHGAVVSTICGPFDMPSVEDLERAIVAVVQRFPHSRLSWSVDPTTWRWEIPADQHSGPASAVVVERSRSGHTSMGETLDEMVRDPAVAPLTVFRYEDHFGIRISHEYGDGRFYDQVLGALMSAATAGPMAWDTRPGSRFPLATAVLRTFGKSPKRVLAAVADRPERPAPPITDYPRPRVPWAAARRTISVSIPDETRRQIIGWGKTSAPGASWFALLVSLLLRSAELSGLRVAEDVSVVMDLRRFLPAGAQDLDGNFVVGVPFNLNYQTPPAEIGAKIRACVKAGRPVATQAASALSRRHGGTAPTEVDPAQLPRATFTSIGVAPRVDALPFRGDAPSFMAGSVEPDGPHGLTFLITETSDTCTVNVSFHDNVIDTTAVEEALRLARTEPLEILAKW
ncbi:MAG: hypothetical protein ABWY45_12895 [Mycobacterium sp.]